jgi:HD superfamily phosphodiesterase
MDYHGAKDFIVRKLREELKPELLYHSIEHTFDVLESAERIGTLENINGHEITLLKTAALFHDSGMLIQYIGHEEASTVLTKKYLPGFGYSDDDIRIINDMIMTTKLPQCAQTHLEKILCDADLDYLGRDDFFMIAHRLQYEWNKLEINQTNLLKWYELQYNFLTNHKYFTKAALSTRDEKKAQNIADVKELLSKN